VALTRRVGDGAAGAVRCCACVALRARRRRRCAARS